MFLFQAVLLSGNKVINLTGASAIKPSFIPLFEVLILDLQRTSTVKSNRGEKAPPSLRQPAGENICGFHLEMVPEGGGLFLLLFELEQ